MPDLTTTVLTQSIAGMAFDGRLAGGTDSKIGRRGLSAFAMFLGALVGAALVLHVGRALGAGPLGHDREHARRVSDLTVYLRQHHGERDLAALGAALATGPAR